MQATLFDTGFYKTGNVRVRSGEVEGFSPPKKEPKVVSCFESLSDEVLTHIFQFLGSKDRPDEVCHRFREVKLAPRRLQAAFLRKILRENQCASPFGINCSNGTLSTRDSTDFFMNIHSIINSYTFCRPIKVRKYDWSPGCAQLVGFLKEKYDVSVATIFKVFLSQEGESQNSIEAQVERIRKKLVSGPEISKLVIPRNSVFCFPREICQCKKLTEIYVEQEPLLDFGRCTVSDRATPVCITLPPQIASLTKLKVLSLPSVGLRIVPSQIGSLSSLWKLCLPNNNLKEVPSAIEGCKNLVELNLCGNELTSLPSSVGKLVKLKILLVRHNQIKEISSVIKRLEQLKDLNIAFNPLGTLEINKLAQQCSKRQFSLNVDRRQHQMLKVCPSMVKMDAFEDFVQTMH